MADTSKEIQKMPTDNKKEEVEYLSEEAQLIVRQNDNRTDRAVDTSNETRDILSAGTNAGVMGKPTAENSSVPSIRTKEISNMHTRLQDSTTWVKIAEQLHNMLNVDYSMNNNKMRAIGNFYSSTKHCEFLIGMYQNEGSKLLDFKRMSGDGFAMDGFYREFRQMLSDEKLTQEQYAAETDDDDFLDEEDRQDAATDVGPNSYLKLQRNSQLVSNIVDQLSRRDLHARITLMGVLAHNSSNKDNATVMVEHCGTRLADTARETLQKTEHAALARQSAVLLANLVTMLKVGEQLIEVMAEAMARWAQNSTQKPLEVGESQETVAYLALALSQLMSTSEGDVQEALENVPEDSGMDEVVTILTHRSRLQKNMASNYNAVLKLL